MNGDIYEGQFEDNLRHGQGTYIHEDTQVKYKGAWVKGQRQVGNHTHMLLLM